jgi:GNAT superfamily N-acetyltransferase
MEIRALRDSDERSGFQSGDPDLDRFLRKYAGQNQFRHHIGTTYAAIEDERILGYSTIAAGHIEIEDLPQSLRRKLPGYPLPVLRLARLAVDTRAQGQGLGEELLRFVLNLALRMASEYGCIGVEVDAKPTAVGFYERFGFFRLELVEGQSQARPEPIAMFLPVGKIEAAARSRK